jgi:hypothetical protein
MAGYLRRVAIAGTRPWAQPGGLRQAVVAGTISPAVSDSPMVPPVSPAVSMSQEGTTSPTPNAPEMERPASPSRSRPQPAGAPLVHAPPAPMLPALDVREPGVPAAPGAAEPPEPAVVQTLPPSMPSVLRASEPLAPSVPEVSAPPTPRVPEGSGLIGPEGPEPNPAEADSAEDRYRPGISVVRRNAPGRWRPGTIGPRIAGPAPVELRPSEQIPAVLSEAVQSELPRHLQKVFEGSPPAARLSPAGHLSPGAASSPGSIPPTILPPPASVMPTVAGTSPPAVGPAGQNGRRAPAEPPTVSQAEGTGPSRLSARPPPGPAGTASAPPKSVLAPARATITIGRMDVQVVNRPHRAAGDGRPVETPQFQRQAVDPGTLDRFRLLP